MTLVAAMVKRRSTQGLLVVNTLSAVIGDHHQSLKMHRGSSHIQRLKRLNAAKGTMAIGLPVMNTLLAVMGNNTSVLTTHTKLGNQYTYGG